MNEHLSGTVFAPIFRTETQEASRNANKKNKIIAEGKLLQIHIQTKLFQQEETYRQYSLDNGNVLEFTQLLEI